MKRVSRMRVSLSLNEKGVFPPDGRPAFSLPILPARLRPGKNPARRSSGPRGLRDGLAGTDRSRGASGSNFRTRRSHPSPAPRRLRKGGFSAIELVVVILVAAVLAIVVGIGASEIQGAKLSSAARKLESDIRYAQQLAMTKRISHGLVFNFNVSGGAAPNTYTVFQVSVPANVPARDPAGGANMIINYNTDPELQGVTITGPSFCDGVNPCGSTLQFNGEGVPTNTAGSLPLVSGSVVLNYQGASTTVSVVPQTGKVS